MNTTIEDFAHLYGQSVAEIANARILMHRLSDAVLDLNLSESDLDHEISEIA